MSTEIFKEIKESEKKAEEIILNSEKEKEKIIKKANDEAQKIISNAEIKINEDRENKLKKTKIELSKLKEENNARIISEIAKLGKTAKNNMEDAAKQIINDIVK